MIEVVIHHQCAGEGATYLAKFIEENFTGKDVLVLDDHEFPYRTTNMVIANWYANHPNGVVIFVARFNDSNAWPYDHKEYRKIQNKVNKLLACNYENLTTH